MPGINETSNPSSSQIYNSAQAPQSASAGSAESSSEIFQSRRTLQPSNLVPATVASLLRFTGASHDSERRFCELAGVLAYARFAEAEVFSASTRDDSLTRLMLSPVDWNAVEIFVAPMVDMGNAGPVTRGLKALVDHGSPTAWKAFPLAEKMAQIKMGHPESWPRQITELLLRSRNLVGADLRKAHLQYVDMSNLDLANADLVGADLTHATLTNANFDGAKFGGAACVFPLIEKYHTLRHGPNELRALLHPLAQECGSPNDPNKNARITDIWVSDPKFPIQAYSRLCKWNLLPPMTTEAANFLLSKIAYSANERDWLHKHQDLANQLILNAADLKLSTETCAYLRRRMEADPKVAEALKTHKPERCKNHFIGITEDGKTFAVPFANYRNACAKLKQFPGFDLKNLLAATSTTHWRAAEKKDHEGLLAATVSAVDYLDQKDAVQMMASSGSPAKQA